VGRSCRCVDFEHGKSRFRKDVNLKTAKALSVTIPLKLLARAADDVIE
jgi:hypothetical protein